MLGSVMKIYSSIYEYKEECKDVV
jgi:hypothetical protein